MTQSNLPFVGLRKHRVNQFPCHTGGYNAYKAVGDLSGKIYTVIHARRVLLLLYFNFILFIICFCCCHDFLSSFYKFENWGKYMILLVCTLKLEIKKRKRRCQSQEFVCCGLLLIILLLFQAFICCFLFRRWTAMLNLGLLEEYMKG